MSGHSKWKNIAHKKGAQDAVRGKIFTKYAREMAVAIKEGGADINSNTKLKDIVAKAKASNVPNDNINRIIEKYKSGGVSENYEAITYEGYGPEGVAVIVETLTDNKNRSAADVRHFFDKYGGNMGQAGCVSWQFENMGVIVIEREGVDEEKLMLTALELGATDFDTEDEVYEIHTEVGTFSAIRDALSDAGYEFLEADMALVPQNYSAIESEDNRALMEKLLNMLEDNDDVQHVWHNWENQ